MAKFTEHELKWMENHPDALHCAADYNDQQESQADAMGADSSAQHHRARRLELQREADRIQNDWTGSVADGEVKP